MLFEPINIRILNRINKLAERLSSKARTVIVFLCFVILGSLFSLDPQNPFDARRMAVVSIIVLVQVAACYNAEIKPVKWNRLPAIMLELFALNIIAIRPIHPVGQGYVYSAFVILILLPMLYIALINRGDQTWFIDLLSYAVILTGIVCFVYSLILVQGVGDFVPEGRMAGVTKNPNYYGMVGLAMAMSGFYNIARNQANIAWEITTSVCAGIGISMIFMSVSRTAVLSLAVCTAVFVIFLIGEIRSKYDRKRLLVQIVLMILIIIFAVAALNLQQRVVDTAKGEKNSIPVDSITILTEVYAENGEDETPDADQNSIKERFSADTDINSFSSGRIRMWSIYIKHLNLVGNDYEAEKKDGIFVEMRESRAHNNIIDYAFRLGIPGGLLYTVFYFAVIVKAVGIVFRRRRFTACDMWIVMTTAAYAIYAIIEISTLPFTRYIPCLFFLSAGCLMADSDDKKTAEINEK